LTWVYYFIAQASKGQGNWVIENNFENKNNRF
jgi:hypothetical protein